MSDESKPEGDPYLRDQLADSFYFVGMVILVSWAIGFLCGRYL